MPTALALMSAGRQLGFSGQEPGASGRGDQRHDDFAGAPGPREDQQHEQRSQEVERRQEQEGSERRDAA